jgi:hypothetical protein
MESLFGGEAATGALGTALSLAWAVFAFSRGIARLIIGFVCWGAGIYAGYWAFRHSPTILSPFFTVIPTSAMIITSIIAGGVIHQSAKRLVDMVFEAAGPAATTKGKLAHAGWSLFPGAAMLLVLALGARWLGAVNLMNSVQDATQNKAERAQWSAPTATRFMLSLSRGKLGDMLYQYDPLHSSEAATLCAILITEFDEELFKKLLRDPQVGAILRNPEVQKFRADKDWKKAASHGSFGRALTLTELRTLLKNDSVSRPLREIKIEELLHQIWAPKAKIVSG